MTSNLKEHTQLVSANIKATAETVHKTVFDELGLMQEGLPGSFQKLPVADRRALVEELRAGLNIWVNGIDPVAARLRLVLRRLQDELAESVWRQPREVSEEETWPWTQTARDQEAREQQLCQTNKQCATTPEKRGLPKTL